MNSIAQTPGIPVSRNGYYTADTDIPAIRNTRYLSAAAHLRRPMLPNEVTDPGTGVPRPPLPVGRIYSFRVLFRPGSCIPMPAVDMGRVKKNCWITLLQTTIRDVAAVGALAAGLVIEPWGMITMLAAVVAAVMLTRRSRFYLALIFLGVVCVALALVNGNRNERISLSIPLACLALCFIAYLADVWLSMYHVRRIWRKSARQTTWASAPQSSLADGSPATGKGSSAGRKPLVRSEYRQWPYADGNGYDGNGYGRHDLALGTPDAGGATPAVGGHVRVYYGSDGFVGAGTAFPPLPLTVPLGKPLKDSGIETFSVSELMSELCRHLLSQGVGDAEIYGRAYQPLPANGTGQRSHEPGHFTYGLPHLDVTEVVATPAPDAEKFLGTPLSIMRLSFLGPSDDEMLDLVNRSPSMHPDRHYARVRTTSWDGQLTATVFVNAALQGHFLRMIMRPYVLAPVVNELNVADELTKWNAFFLACVAVQVTTRQFMAGAAKFKRSDDKLEKKSQAEPYRSGLRSTREYYARPYVSNMHQQEDSARAIQVIEEKIFTATMEFLREHNVDVADYEKQVQNVIYNNTMFGDGVFNNGNNNQINNSKGNENNQSNNKGS